MRCDIAFAERIRLELPEFMYDAFELAEFQPLYAQNQRDHKNKTRVLTRTASAAPLGRPTSTNHYW